MKKSLDYENFLRLNIGMKQKHPLRQWRFDRDMSLFELANRSGVSGPTLSRVEHGHMPSSRVAVKIKNATGISVYKLIAAAGKK